MLDQSYEADAFGRDLAARLGGELNELSSTVREVGSEEDVEGAVANFLFLALHVAGDERLYGLAQKLGWPPFGAAIREWLAKTDERGQPLVPVFVRICADRLLTSMLAQHRAAATERAPRIREAERARDQARADVGERAAAILRSETDLVRKFVEIAHRKASSMDEYGDEDLDMAALYREIDVVMEKLRRDRDEIGRCRPRDLHEWSSEVAREANAQRGANFVVSGGRVWPTSKAPRLSSLTQSVQLVHAPNEGEALRVAAEQHRERAARDLADAVRSGLEVAYMDHRMERMSIGHDDALPVEELSGEEFEAQVVAWL